MRRICWLNRLPQSALRPAKIKMVIEAESRQTARFTNHLNPGLTPEASGVLRDELIAEINGAQKCG